MVVLITKKGNGNIFKQGSTKRFKLTLTLAETFSLSSNSPSRKPVLFVTWRIVYKVVCSIMEVKACMIDYTNRE